LKVNDFYFLFTIVKKVLVTWTENPNSERIRIFYRKKVIFDEKKLSVSPPPPRNKNMAAKRK
jgi:hypothetical protein